MPRRKRWPSQVEALKLTANAPPPWGNAAGISKEDFEKLHLAHNATLMEREAVHNKALKQEAAAK
jgi:hypothetical protein